MRDEKESTPSMWPSNKWRNRQSETRTRWQSVVRRATGKSDCQWDSVHRWERQDSPFRDKTSEKVRLLIGRLETSIIRLTYLTDYKNSRRGAFVSREILTRYYELLNTWYISPNGRCKAPGQAGKEGMCPPQPQTKKLPSDNSWQRPYSSRQHLSSVDVLITSNGVITTSCTSPTIIHRWVSSRAVLNDSSIRDRRSYIGCFVLENLKIDSFRYGNIGFSSPVIYRICGREAQMNIVV